MTCINCCYFRETYPEKGICELLDMYVAAGDCCDDFEEFE